MSFRQFLNNHEITDDPLGDFIQDAKYDEELHIIKSKSQLVRHLKSCNACEAAIEAGVELWQEYKGSKKCLT